MSTTDTMTDHSEALTAQVAPIQQALADLIVWSRAHPEMRVIQSHGLRWIVAYGEYDHADAVRALSDGAPIGAIKKDAVGDSLHVERDFGAGVTVSVVILDREDVCTRRVVGTVTEEVPDPDAPTITVEREVIEWDCAPILGGTR